jgi:hypothetical protein
MSDIEQLKTRINAAGENGIKTARVRDDYEPIGDLLIRDLVATGEYVTFRIKTDILKSEWFIFAKDKAPYGLES